MRQYATVEQVMNYLLLEVDSSFAPQIEEWIEQSSKEIERITNRVFEADSTSSTRVFDGNRKSILPIDDCIEIESVDIDGRSIDVLNYPANKLPITSIYYEGGFDSGRQNISIEAKWGYSEEPPEDIVFACVVMTAGTVQANLAGLNDLKSEKIGNYQVTYKDDKQFDNIQRVKSILSLYKRYGL